MVWRSQFGRIPPGPGLTMQTSTTVTLGFRSPGKMQARPNGSGMRATRTSPGSRYVHPSSAAFALVKNRADRLRYSPSPNIGELDKANVPGGILILAFHPVAVDEHPAGPNGFRQFRFRPPFRQLLAHVLTAFPSEAASVLK